MRCANAQSVVGVSEQDASPNFPCYSRLTILTFRRHCIILPIPTFYINVPHSDGKMSGKLAQHAPDYAISAINKA